MIRLPLLALVLLAGSTCRGKSDPSDSRPATSPEVSVAGIDTSTLTPRERREWAAQVSELLAPCPDTPVSIAACVNEKRPCKTCLPAAELLRKQVQAGIPKKEREDAYQARFSPSKVRTVVIDGSPELGAPDAVVTIVEWADFQCPFCRLVSPVLEELTRRFEGDVKVVYKHYPLDSHPHGLPAARAAVAAQNQGKFWEMHHMIYDHQDRLEPADLEGYARELGLDMAKFRADFSSPQTLERIAKDKAQAEQLGLSGTPMIFINGREVDLRLLPNVYDDLEDWVRLDIELAGRTPKPRPKKAPAATATPSAPSAAAPPASAAPGQR